MQTKKAYFIGGGIGALAGSFYLIKDAGYQGRNITIIDDQKVLGGACDGLNIAEKQGYMCRGGRMLNLQTYECLWALLKQVPSLSDPKKTVFQEIDEFNNMIKTHCNSRIVDANGVRYDVETMGFTQQDRFELLHLFYASEDAIGDSLINEWFSENFFTTKFWYMWQTTFAFQTWSSAIELKRYMHRLLHEFVRIQTLEGVARTPYDQYDSLVLPIQKYIEQQGVVFQLNTLCDDIQTDKEKGSIVVKKLSLIQEKKQTYVDIQNTDLVFFQNGSMTDGASVGSHTQAPVFKQIGDTSSFTLWQKLADRHPGVFGNPKKFYQNSNETMWESFTLTTKNKDLFDYFVTFQKNSPGTGALMTFKDSNWLMSIVIAYQPHFIGQEKDTYILWGYGLFPNKIGNFVHKRMMDCTGEEIFAELVGHCRVPQQLIKDYIVLPCMMPYIISMFQPRTNTDRPLPVPKQCKNLGLISQFVEIPNDIVFTVEYSVRAAQMAVYQLCGLKKKIPKITRYDLKPSILMKSVYASYKRGKGVEIVSRKECKCIACKYGKFTILGGIGAGIATIAYQYLK